MLARNFTLSAIVLSLSGLCGALAAAESQQPKAASAPQPAATQPTAGADDASRKAAILNSAPWRRAMFEFKEWLSVQQLYTPEQVAQIKDRFNRRVAGMTAGEVEMLLADMEAKFKILDSPEAREARAWMAQYLSVMSDKKRDEVLKDIPNPATMTAAQLRQEIMKIEGARASIDQQQAAFNETRQSEVTSQIREDRIAQQTYTRERANAPTTYSPYHSSKDVNQRLNNARIGAGMSFYIGPGGGVGIGFTPSSF